MIVGTILVLISWIFLIIVISILGQSLLLLITTRSLKGDITPRLLRISLWWGLIFLIITVLTLNLFLPLGSGLSAVIFLTVAALALGTVAIQRPRFQLIGIPRSGRIAAISAVLVIAVVFLAFAALGPVTNYDTGLYHLGAIKYSGEYSTISGLANLYFPFGYNTSLYPFAAFLSNGPWGAEGFRLANGLIISLLVCDLVLRLIVTRGDLRKLSVGSWILLIATLIGLVPLVALSDYWVTSPSSDATVMLLTFVSCAYLADGLWKRKGSIDLATSFVLAVILFSLRPTMAVFLTGILLVIGVWAIKYRKQRNSLQSFLPLFLAGLIGILLLVVQTIRDYFLSGWFQFPLSIYSFDPPWAAIDPTGFRAATLGNARNPEDIWGSIEGFAWVEPWVRRLPEQWETFLIIALALAAVILALSVKIQSVHIRIRLLLLLVFPSVVTSVMWFFFSPPAFRFGWGPIFSLFIIPIGFMIQGLRGHSRTRTPLQFTVPAFIGVLVIGVFAVTIYTATARLPKLLNPIPQQFTVATFYIDYQATPIVTVPVVSRNLTSGLAIQQPTESDQCWNNYPLCTPIVSESVTMRDGGIQKGFLP